MVTAVCSGVPCTISDPCLTYTGYVNGSCTYDNAFLRPCDDSDYTTINDVCSYGICSGSIPLQACYTTGSDNSVVMSCDHRGIRDLPMIPRSVVSLFVS